MSSYRKGIETKKRIYNSAKKTFFLYAYKDATIERIAAEAQVPLGLVNYYFKKNEVLVLAMREYEQSINNLLDKYIHKNFNPLCRRVLYTLVFFGVILRNENSKALYKEIFENELISVTEHDFGDVSAIIRIFDISITESIFRRLIIAEYGARKELLCDRYDRMDETKSRDFICFLSTIAIRLAGVDIKKIMKCVNEAQKIYISIDTSGLSFFPWS